MPNNLGQVRSQKKWRVRYAHEKLTALVSLCGYNQINLYFKSYSALFAFLFFFGVYAYFLKFYN